MKDESNSIVKHWVVKQSSVAILLTFFTILLGIILNEIQSKVGWGMLITSLVFILALFGIVIWLVVRYVFAVSIDIADEIKETLDKYSGIEKRSWLITGKELVRYESRCNFSEIWLISSDLSTDCVGGQFHKVVLKNLKKGIKYRYFVPNTPVLKVRMDQLFKYNNNHPNLKVTYIDDSFFFLVPNFDFAIYNPYKQGDSSRVAYMGLPIPGENNLYHVRFSDDLTDVLMGKLAPLVTE